jgi:peptidyl-prolyl cis-trans isomerase A (cyclophilin A)
MIKKIYLIGLLVTIMVTCGCAKKVPQTPPENNQVQQNNANTNAPAENATTSTQSKKVRLETSLGNIVIELNSEKAPITVGNFLDYVESCFYNETIFHRVIKGFMIQGGGFTKTMEQKPTKAPIKNEASNGLLNDRGTIAMARTNNPDSATCQFFINQVDNDINYKNAANPGYAVFGKVVEGMDVVDKIANVRTTILPNGMRDVPVDTIEIISATVVSQ